MTRFEQEVDFEPTNDPLHPWEAWVDGKHWQVAVTARPDGTRRYALHVDGRHEEDFTEWPPAWSRPPLPVAMEAKATGGQAPEEGLDADLAGLIRTMEMEDEAEDRRLANSRNVWAEQDADDLDEDDEYDEDRSSDEEDDEEENDD